MRPSGRSSARCCGGYQRPPNKALERAVSPLQAAAKPFISRFHLTTGVRRMRCVCGSPRAIHPARHPLPDRGGFVGKLKFVVLLAFAAAYFTISPPKANAQVAVEVGPPPVCPYGYFD